MITNDLTSRAIEWALQGLETRSQAIAQDIANAEVPNYRATTVEFEGQLRTALDAGRISRFADPVVSTTPNPPGPNGNTVKLEDEMVELIQTNLMRSAMVEAFNYKAGLLRTAMRSTA